MRNDEVEQLTNIQKSEIVQEYKDVINDIHVDDFQSAVERCKQQLCRNIQRQKSEQARKHFDNLRYTEVGYTSADRKIDYNYEYVGRVLRGEISPPSAKSTKRFVSVMKKKYGSVKAYYTSKVNE